MHRYERLDIWKRGIALAARVHALALRSTRWADQSLWRQISRAAVSIPANVAEGAQRGSDREFARFLGIAMGSAAELHTLLVLARETDALSTTEAPALAREALELRRMAAALRARVLGMPRRSKNLSD